MYTGEVETIRESAEQRATLEQDGYQEIVHRENHALFSIHVFAEKLQDVSAKNAILKATVQRTAQSQIKDDKKVWFVPSLIVVNLVYYGTPETSPARRLLINIWSTLNFTAIFTAAKELHADFLADLEKEMQLIRPLKSGESGNRALIRGLWSYIEQEKKS